MNRILFFSVALCFAACEQSSGCEDTPVPEELMGELNDFDSLRAEQLGADEYGMRQYVMAFLKAGPNRNQSEEEAATLQRAHLDNITRMAEEGTLVVAGPFTDDAEVRGIYIFNVSTLEEAEKLTSTDPAVKAGRLVMELHPWYGSAALVEVNETHKRIARRKI